MISAQGLADVFVDLADTLADDFDLIEFLDRLTRHTAAVSGEAAVGLTLADQNHELRYLAASNEPARLMQLFQLQNAEGPCLDSFHTEEPVTSADLARAASRWPAFAPRALEEGFRSVHAFPMRLRDQVIGALDIFGNEPSGTCGESDSRIVQSLADLATIAIIQEQVIRRAETLTEQLSDLARRVVTRLGSVPDA